MNTQWDKLLDVVNRTNDKVFFFSNEKPYVIMSLEQYERSLAADKTTSLLTEEELIDKINRDIAVWKAQADTDHEADLANTLVEENADTTDSADQDDDFHIEPVNI